MSTFADGSNLVIELQRRRGDTITFHRMYRYLCEKLTLIYPDLRTSSLALNMQFIAEFPIVLADSAVQ